MNSICLLGILYINYSIYPYRIFENCFISVTCNYTGHIGFRIRVESTAKTTAEAFQPTNTRGCDADTMPVEVLRGG